jgi:hypothetical protein
VVQMAIAFVVRHPAVTSAIIGPRTMEHLDGYLTADGVTLSTDMLDCIDQVVPPAATINVADNMWEIGTPTLAAAARRPPDAPLPGSAERSPDSARVHTDGLPRRGALSRTVAKPLPNTAQAAVGDGASNSRRGDACRRPSRP